MKLCHTASFAVVCQLLFGCVNAADSDFKQTTIHQPAASDYTFQLVNSSDHLIAQGNSGDSIHFDRKKTAPGEYALELFAVDAINRTIHLFYNGHSIYLGTVDVLDLGSTLVICPITGALFIQKQKNNALSANHDHLTIVSLTDIPQSQRNSLMVL